MLSNLFFLIYLVFLFQILDDPAFLDLHFMKGFEAVSGGEPSVSPLPWESWSGRGGADGAGGGEDT